MCYSYLNALVGSDIVGFFSNFVYLYSLIHNLNSCLEKCVPSSTHDSKLDDTQGFMGMVGTFNYLAALCVSSVDIKFN